MQTSLERHSELSRELTMAIKHASVEELGVTPFNLQRQSDIVSTSAWEEYGQACY